MEKKLEPGTSPVEKLLGMEFISDPRQSKFALPKPPKGHDGKPYTFSRFTVTPEIARDWSIHRLIVPDRTPRELKHDEFDPNRRIQSYRIRHWNRVFTNKAMDGETWNPDTPPGIVFSWDGFILDGQHRITGFLLGGRDTFETPLAVNYPWSVLSVMDTPLRRNAGQMTDVPYPQAAAHIARYLLPAIYGTETRDHTMKRNMHEIVAITRKYPWFRNPDWITEIKKLGRLHYPTTALGSVVFGALAAGASPFEVQGFMDGLKPSFGSPSSTLKEKVWRGPGSDPCRLLGQRYIHRRRSRSESDLRSDAGIFRKAMTVWLNRNEENPDSVDRFNRIDGNLPPFWNSDALREFHRSIMKED